MWGGGLCFWNFVGVVNMSSEANGACSTARPPLAVLQAVVGYVVGVAAIICCA